MLTTCKLCKQNVIDDLEAKFGTREVRAEEEVKADFKEI